MTYHEISLTNINVISDAITKLNRFPEAISKIIADYSKLTVVTWDMVTKDSIDPMDEMQMRLHPKLTTFGLNTPIPLAEVKETISSYAKKIANLAGFDEVLGYERLGTADAFGEANPRTEEPVLYFESMDAESSEIEFLKFTSNFGFYSMYYGFKDLCV